MQVGRAFDESVGIRGWEFFGGTDETAAKFWGRVVGEAFFRGAGERAGFSRVPVGLFDVSERGDFL